MELEYKPSEDFVVNNLQSLVDYDVTGSKELWLIQCPISQVCLEDEISLLKILLKMLIIKSSKKQIDLCI